MFGHVTKLFTAYHHGALSAEDRRRVESHAGRCARCRAGLDEIGRTVRQLRDFAAAGPLPTPVVAGVPQARAASRRLVLAGAAAVVLICSLLVWRQLPQVPAQLRIGEWLETSSDVTFKIADIGEIRLQGNTRLRLVEDRPEAHRVEMERGIMHATVWAPPRLFFVDTPSATAIDLGCAYTLQVNDNGSSLLTVTTGLVELQTKMRSAIVRAGWAAKTRKVEGPGTPYVVESSEEMQRALDVLDFDPDPAGKEPALAVVLRGSQDRDLITLWHLLSRVDSGLRQRIYDRMLTLGAPREGTTSAGIVALDPVMMNRLKEQIGLVW